MSARQLDPQISPLHPRETTALFGHRDAELALLSAYRGGRIPHAWLIGGPQGIGKATLAYRMARFVLAHRNPTASDVQDAETLWVDPSDPVARHVRAVATIGRDAPIVEDALAATGVAMQRHDTLQAATRWAFGRAHAGDAVLLSPACASLDMFRNYAHRAEVFVDEVRAMAAEHGDMTA